MFLNEKEVNSNIEVELWDEALDCKTKHSKHRLIYGQEES